MVNIIETIIGIKEIIVEKNSKIKDCQKIFNVEEAFFILDKLNKFKIAIENKNILINLIKISN